MIFKIVGCIVRVFVRNFSRLSGCGPANDSYFEITLSRSDGVLRFNTGICSTEPGSSEVHSLLTYLGRFAQPSRGLDLPPRSILPRLRQTLPVSLSLSRTCWDPPIPLATVSYLNDVFIQRDIGSAELQSSRDHVQFNSIFLSR